MEISNRARLIPNTVDRVFNEIDNTPDVISLAGGTPLFIIPKRLLAQPMKEAQNNVHYFQYPRYTQGILPLRECIARDLTEEFGYTVNPENILITVGASAALFATFQTFLNPSDALLLFSPHWFGYLNQIKLTGAKIRFIPLNETQKWDINFSILGDKVSNKTRLLLFTNPSSPTGRVYSSATIKKLLQFAIQNKIIIVADETYRHIVYNETQFFSIGKIIRSFNNVVIIRSFSKDFSISGMRLGFIFAQPDIIQSISQVHLAMNMSAPVFSQELGLLLYRHKNTILKKMKKEYIKRREFVCSYLDRWPLIFNYVKPHGGFFLFPRYIGKVNSQKFFHKLLREARVAVRPGADFGVGGEYHIRISFAYPMGHLHTAFERLQKFFNTII